MRLLKRASLINQNSNVSEFSMSKTQSPFFSEIKDKAKLIFTNGEMLKTFQGLKGSASGFDGEIEGVLVKSESEDRISKITS